MQLLLILGIALAIAAVAFALQNNATVTVTLGIWSFDSSLAMVLLMAVGVGALIAALVSLPDVIKSRWTSSRLRREVNQLEEEKAALERRSIQLEAELATLTPEPVPPELPPAERPRYLGFKSMLLGNQTEKEKPKE
ncbi:MAG: LapA family protein [Nitrosospira sp.]|nr:LapA family protein [Nitrosospira sp.]